MVLRIRTQVFMLMQQALYLLNCLLSLIIIIFIKTLSLEITNLWEHEHTEDQ